MNVNHARRRIAIRIRSGNAKMQINDVVRIRSIRVIQRPHKRKVKKAIAVRQNRRQVEHVMAIG